MRGYDMTTDQLLHIADVYETLDKAAAVSASEIAEGLARVASAANTAGIEFETLASQVSIIHDVTQQDAGSIGNFLKTMYTRLGSISAGKMRYIDEDGISVDVDVNNLEKALRAGGIALRKNEKEFRNYNEVLDEVAQKWDTMSDIVRNGISEQLGGKRGANYVNALISNYDRVHELVNIAADSEGAALERFDVYLQSIQSRTEVLHTQLEELYMHTLDSETFGNVIDIAQDFVTWADDVDLVKTALMGLTANAVTRGIVSMGTLISNTAAQITALGGGLTGLMGVISAHPVMAVTTAALGVAGVVNAYEAA